MAGSFTVKKYLKNYKLWLIAGFLVVVTLSWLDQQYLTMSRNAIQYSDMQRKLMHLGLLAGIFATGFFVWYQSGRRWLLQLWVLLYGICIAVVLAAGLLHITTDFFDVSLLKKVSVFRSFFTGPIPYAGVAVLSLLK